METVNNAIFFVLTDSYVFAAATVLMGIKKFSPSVLDKSDVIIFSDDITKNHVNLLQQIHSNVFVRPFSFPESWKPIIESPKNGRWGQSIIAKLYGFQLVKEYETAVLLDADMLIRGDISELFCCRGEIAWRSIMAWDPKIVLANCLESENDTICAPSGGLLVFTNKLNQYNISEEDVLEAYNMVKECRGGLDELIISYIVYKNRIIQQELDVSVYNVPPRRITEGSKIIHFLPSIGVETKPWKNLAAWLFFEDWHELYNCWLQMGGEQVVNFTDQDWIGLFGFDKAKKIKTLSGRVKELEKSLSQSKMQLKEIKGLKLYRIVTSAKKLIKRIIGVEKLSAQIKS